MGAVNRFYRQDESFGYWPASLCEGDDVEPMRGSHFGITKRYSTNSLRADRNAYLHNFCAYLGAKVGRLMIKEGQKLLYTFEIKTKFGVELIRNITNHHGTMRKALRMFEPAPFSDYYSKNTHAYYILAFDDRLMCISFSLEGKNHRSVIDLIGGMSPSECVFIKNGLSGTFL